MALISAAEVIRRIELYYQSGSLNYLSAHEQALSARAVLATAKNKFKTRPHPLSQVARPH
jgi:hypothetical protein